MPHALLTYSVLSILNLLSVGRRDERTRDVLVPSSACSMREVFLQKDDLMLLLVIL